MIYDYNENDNYSRSKFREISKGINRDKSQLNKILKWVNILEDIDYILIDISDKIKSENIKKHYVIFGLYKGIKNIDCIQIKINSEGDYVKEDYIKELFKKLPQLTVHLEEYSNNERYLDDPEEGIIYTTVFKIFFKEEMTEDDD